MKKNLDALVEELSKRKRTPFRLEDYLFKQQLDFVNDKSRRKVGVTTRRAGKTTSCGSDLMFTAHTNPDTVGLYLTISRSMAKRNLWTELKRVDKKFQLGCEFNESELKVEHPNGSLIYCSGASDKTEIEKFRGLALIKVYIDEAQSFPSYIEELIDDVIRPALLDHAGTLCVIGTPGPVPSGFFFNLTQNTKWSHHKWSFFDNHKLPFLKLGMTHQGQLDDVLSSRGVGADDPSIQREYYGNWVLDKNSLVYKYSSEVNHYESLPWKDDKKVTYLLGVDLGFNDADALALIAFDDQSKCTYLVEEWITAKQGISELVAQIEQVRARYNVSKIVMDQGGLGKKIAEEIIRRFQLPVQPAEKIRKNEFIELFNDALRTGQIKAKNNSRFAEDCMKVEWDLDKMTPDKKVISKRFHSDVCEALLYVWREAYSYTFRKDPEKLVPGSKAWNDDLQRKLEEEAEEYFKTIEDNEKNDPYSGKY